MGGPTHLTGTFPREAYPLMASRQSGCIVNVDCRCGRTSETQRLWRRQGRNRAANQIDGLRMASRGIRVNAIAPGYVATDRVNELAADGSVDIAKLQRRIPLGRLARPEEIAGVIAFLCSPAASYITGAVLSVDGRWSAFGDAGDTLA